MKRFGIIWVGQLASLVGTGMTRFALILFVYEEQGTATAVALVGFSAYVPFVLVSPVAGVLVDRSDRKRVMLVADLAAGLSSIGLLIALTAGDLQLWHVYVATAVAGMAEAFQVPAFSTVITLLVPKAHYMRASGMRSLAESMSQIAAPALAGVVLLASDLEGILVIDLVTFLVAVGTLLAVPVPRAVSPKGPGEQPHLWLELRAAIDFIRGRPGLVGLLGLFALINLLGALTYYAVLPVLVLARTGQDSSALAAVQVALGVGGVVGGLLVSTWGGPRRRIHSVLAAAALSFGFGDLLFAVGTSVPVWLVGGFVASFFIPFITGADQAIWQAKTPPHLQGRVFGLRGMVRLATLPIGYGLAGPLVDRVFERPWSPVARSWTSSVR